MNKIILNENYLHKVVSNILTKFIKKVPLSDGIYEFTDDNTISKYSNQIWKILQNSYKTIGGFKSYKNVNEMCNRISLAIIGVQDNMIVACAIYRDDLGGQKLNGCGTLNGSTEQKKILRAIIKDDIENLQKYHWVEVSYPLEKWFKELNGSPIPSSIAYKLLHKSKSKIKEIGDGVHYQRNVGSDDNFVTKAIYGFKDDTTYQRVMNNIEKYCGFENYDDFKEYANSLPKLDESFNYYDNHHDEEISKSMEVIIQIGNVWDEGWREITPNMKLYLITAITKLNNYQNKNKQIISLIKNGKYYLNNMSVLECHEAFNYILSPAL